MIFCCESIFSTYFFLFSDSNQEYNHLFMRLRSLHIFMTIFKVNEILNELPTKRLLLQFVRYQNEVEDDGRALTEQLTKHFKFRQSQKEVTTVAGALTFLLKSDAETGQLAEHMDKLYRHVDNALLQQYLSLQERDVDLIRSSIQLRLQTNPTLKEDNLTREEMDRVSILVAKYRQQLLEQLAAVQSSRLKFQKMMMSFLEVERKMKTIKIFKTQQLERKRKRKLQKEREKKGQMVETNVVEVIDEASIACIPLEFKNNWMVRFINANGIGIPKDDFNLDENQKENNSETEKKISVLKYTEIANVCNEFLATALADARTIVREHFYPRHKKTLFIELERDVDGRPLECGRGLDQGKTYVYSMGNITYRVVTDDDGLFNGSDENASKAAGNERRATAEFMQLSALLPKMHAPLTCTVDYMGLRVICTAKQPIQSVINLLQPCYFLVRSSI